MVALMSTEGINGCSHVDGRETDRDVDPTSTPSRRGEAQEECSVIFAPYCLPSESRSHLREHSRRKRAIGSTLLAVGVDTRRG